jgi:hypothetical protein
VQPDHLRIFTLKHFRTPTLAILAGACLSLLGTNALAESTYGYNAAGTGVVIAKARLNLVINVPKLILLRVGSSGATVDTLTWNSGLTWATAPGTLTNGNNQATNWDGTAPTEPPPILPPFPRLPGPTVRVAVRWPTPPPHLVLVARHWATSRSRRLAGLAHPAPSPLATASTGATAFAKTLWRLAAGALPSAAHLQPGLAGQYTSTVTYTATSL